MAGSIENAAALFSTVATHLVDALVTFLIGIIIGKLLEKLTLAVLHKIELNRTLRKAGVRLAVEQTIAYALKYATYLIATIIALNKLQLAPFVANIVAGAILIALFAGVLLSLRDFIPNFIAGMAIYRKGIVHPGDKITYRSIEGTITHTGLLEVKVTTAKGDEIYVPTSVLIKNEFLVRHKPGRKN